MDAELSEQLHYLALKTLSRCIERARHYFERDFPVPALNYKLRGKAAGKAYLQTWEVRLNPVLFVENQQAFIDEVIPHEVAHLIYLCAVRSRAPAWQRVADGHEPSISYCAKHHTLTQYPVGTGAHV
ncbi:protein sprT [Vibrio variabilis]|uniref:Protein sprT n=1 Tax=Vibrio variabilis TaxID=990271 RepID=A0ABQ0JGN3_9VIBR|nr:protein sprT [Vibrio variabilis]